MSDKAIRNAQSTTANYIVAENHGSGLATEVSVSIVAGGVLPYMLNDNFDNKAAVSLNQLFYPISNTSGQTFPYMESPSYPVNRFNDGYIPTTGSGQPPTNESVANKEGTLKRSIGFAMPMYGVGQGLDVSDNVVGSSGQASYKAGPIDLRWDDTRKVWTGGPSIIKGYLSSNITAPTARNYPTSFTVKVYEYVGSGLYTEERTVTMYNYDLHLSINLSTKCVYNSGECSFVDEDIFIVGLNSGSEVVPIYIGCTNE